jgi:hypothetical protein
MVKVQPGPRESQEFQVHIKIDLHGIPPFMEVIDLISLVKVRNQ